MGLGEEFRAAVGAKLRDIAAHADSASGSLYQFFPSKGAVVEALRAQYLKGIIRLWAALGAEAGSLTIAGLVSRLIQLQIEFAEGHPAYLALFGAPPTANGARRREIIRSRIAEAILARRPEMLRSQAFRLAAVVQQARRGLLTLYGRADKGEKAALLEEFKALLAGYLTARLRI